MELFFLCTIIMATASFLSIAMSQPPVHLAIGISDTQLSGTSTTESLPYNEGTYSEIPQPVGMVA